MLFKQQKKSAAKGTGTKKNFPFQSLWQLVVKLFIFSLMSSK